MRTTYPKLQRALARVRQGASISRASVDEDVPFETLRKACRQAGVQSRYAQGRNEKATPLAERAEAVARYLAGESSAVLGRRYGVRPKTITSWARAAGFCVMPSRSSRQRAALMERAS